MKLLKVMIPIILFFNTYLSFADTMTGEDLYNACKGYNQFDLGYCIGFIKGHFETTAMYDPCILAIGNVTFHQLRAIFNKYSKDNPKYWNAFEVTLLQKSIIDSYGEKIKECYKKNEKK